MQTLILAGGLGTRIKDAAGDGPKALIDVGGEPFLHHQLRYLAEQGVRRVVLSIGYRGDMIRDAVGDGKRFGVDIRYCDEGEKLRGTGGAVRFAMEKGLLDPSFFLLWGDSFLPIPFAPVWAASDNGAVTTMTVLRNEGRWDRSNVVFENGALKLYDKRHPAPDMQYIDYGLMVINGEDVRRYVPADTVCDLADMMHVLSVAGELRGYEVRQRFYEIGSVEGLAAFRDFIAGASS